MPGCGPCGTGCKPYKPAAKKPAAKKSTVKKTATKPKAKSATNITYCCCSSSRGCGTTKKAPKKYVYKSSCYCDKCDDYSSYSDSYSDDCSCSDCCSDGYDTYTDSYTDDSYTGDESCNRQSNRSSCCKQ